VKTRAIGSTPQLELVLSFVEKRACYNYELGGFVIHTKIGNGGTPVGTSWGTLGKKGYLHVNIKTGAKQVSWQLHHLVWLWHNGSLPEEEFEIDHINGIRSDNRIENLRLVTRSVNMRNQKKRSDNTSGYCGVYWKSKLRKWGTSIVFLDKTKKHIGYFRTAQEAAEARATYLKDNGYSPRHGE
jgi:hypothetical protein